MDCGSYGTDRIELFAEKTLKQKSVAVNALLHIAREGQEFPERLEDQRPESIEEEKIRDVCERYDFIRGFKIRLEDPMFEEGYAAHTVDMTCNLAAKIRDDYRVMIHLGKIKDMEKLKDIIEIMRPGDIISHIYQPKVVGFNEPGNMIYGVLKKAQERGVLLDTGFGSRQWSFSTIGNACHFNIMPNTVSSDCNATNIVLDPPVSMLYAAMILNTVFMSWQDIFYRTSFSARELLHGISGNDVYKRGDIFVFRKTSCSSSLTDLRGDSVLIREKIIPELTFSGGKIIYSATDI